MDEVGFITLHREAGELFFQFISDCCGQNSFIVTPGVELSLRNTVFGNNKLIAAVIDRLIRHSHILISSGPSNPAEESVQRRRRSGNVELPPSKISYT